MIQYFEASNIYKYKKLLLEVVSEFLGYVKSNKTSIEDILLDKGYLDYTNNDFVIGGCPIHFLVKIHFKRDDKKNFIKNLTYITDLYNGCASYLKKTYNVDSYDNFDGSYILNKRLIVIMCTYEFVVRQDSFESVSIKEDKDFLLDTLNHEFTHYLDLGKHYDVKASGYYKGIYSLAKENDLSFKDKESAIVLDDLMYRLWDFTERNAYATTSSLDTFISGIKKQIDYIKNIPEDSDLWDIVDVYLTSKKYRYRNVRNFFIKHTEYEFDKFKSKAYKNKYNISKEKEFNKLYDNVTDNLRRILGPITYQNLKVNKDGELDVIIKYKRNLYTLYKFLDFIEGSSICTFYVEYKRGPVQISLNFDVHAMSVTVGSSTVPLRTEFRGPYDFYDDNYDIDEDTMDPVPSSDIKPEIPFNNLVIDKLGREISSIITKYIN